MGVTFGSPCTMCDVKKDPSTKRQCLQNGLIVLYAIFGGH